MGNTLTVFVCSTYSDLAAERKAVLDAIRRLQLQHDAMEFFGARTKHPLEACLDEVRKSDILVVIVGHRYGSIVPDRGISFSEAEYQEGYRLKKPCLIYMRDEEVPILPKYMERDPRGLELLEKWKATLRERHMVALFADGAALAVQVAADLGRSIRELQETAEARAEAHRRSVPELSEQVQRLIAGSIEAGTSEDAILSAIRQAVTDVTASSGLRPPAVFLSHANQDQEIVRQLADELSARGIRVWFAEQSLKVGSNWVREIERGLDSVDFIIYFISQASVRSKWVQQEIEVALHRQVSREGGATLLPVLLEPAEVSPLLRTIQWLDMQDRDVEKAADRLAEVIFARAAVPRERLRRWPAGAGRLR